MNKSFKKRIIEFENNTQSDVKEYCKKNNKKYNNSFNFNHPEIDETTKVIIIGTFTPKNGRDNGYYYCSKRNEMYKILDTFFYDVKNIKTRFSEIKAELVENPKNNDKINELKNEFKKYNIALLDVLDYAVSPDDSPADDDIEFFNLDYKTFNKYKNSKAVFICNSRNAESAFEIITKHNSCELKKDYAPQIWRTLRVKRQDKWNEVLSKYL